MVIKSDKTITPFAEAPEGRSSMRQALPQILAVCVKNVLLLGFGMTLGFPTILIPSLSGSSPNQEISLDQETISWIGSINLICVPVGCLLSGAITQPLGRKRAMQLVNFPFLAAWLLFYFSTEVWQIILALCLTGVAGGLLEAPVLTYVAEITQPHLRGMLSSTSTMAVIFGTMTQFLLATFATWRTLTLINCAVPLLSFLLLFLVPETPVWLIAHDRYLDARKAIAWLRGWTALSEIEAEFQELCKRLGKATDIGIDASAPTAATSKTSFLRLFGKRNFVLPYLLISLSFFLGHFNGMTAVQTYAIQIFATFDSPIDKYNATMILGVVQLLGCVACVTLVHYTGKRVFTFISLVGGGFCFGVVGFYAYIHGIDRLQSPNLEQNNQKLPNNWIPTFLIIIQAFFVGIRVLPWILTGEVFPPEIRAVASGLSGGIGYIFGFLANKIFLSMIGTFTLWGVFWINAIVSFGGLAALFWFLPETEGKNLFDITEHFAGNLKLGNKVLRRSESKEHKGVLNNGFQMEERV